MLRLLKFKHIGHYAKSLLFISLLANFHIITIAQIAPTSAEDRMKAVQQRKELEKRSVVNDISFRNIGPVSMSGRVDDIEANPDDPTEFYVAYASGGLWYTKNNGLSFKPVFDSEDIITIGDIAVNWKTNTIWIGTGEVNSSRSSYAGIGVYKSSDGGKTWEYLGLPDSHHIGKIQLHPTDYNVAWVAVLGHLYSPNKERGVYKTTDGGKTWKKTLYVDDNTGAVEMDINPQNPNEVYAAMWHKTRSAWNFEEAGKTSGIYKSTDGGDTWKLISGAGSGFPITDKLGRIGLCVYPKNPQIIYAILDNQDNKPDTTKRDNTAYRNEDFKNITKEQFAQLDNKKLDSFLTRNRMTPKYNSVMLKEGVANDKYKPTVLYDYLNVNTGFESNPIGCEIYRSDNGGINWKKVNEKEIPTLFSSYGYYFAKIFVSPYNENKTYILGVNAMGSTDGGKTWKNIDKNNVHADHHALWVNPKKDSHLINGNDGGVNITYDDGEVWYKANTPAVAQFYNITTDNARPYNVYGGLQDNGVWYVPSQTNRNPFGGSGLGQTVGAEVNVGGADGMQVQIDTRDNATFYYGSQFGNYQRTNRITRDGNRRITPRHELGEFPYRFNWQSPILISSHNPDIVYFGSNHFHRSMNKGDTMITMTADLTNGKKEGDVPYGTLTTISESPTRFGLIYIGTDDGNIHMTKDGGYTWEQLNQTTPVTSKKGSKPQTSNTKSDSYRIQTNNLWVSRVIASQHKEGRVYATLNGYRIDNFAPYVYVSDDYGKTWVQIGKDLPNEPVNVIREDPKNDSILYVGTDGGLYVSLDKGNSFMMWNKGLPKSVPIHDIAIQQRENEIVLGTHGRSLYIAKLDEIQKKAKK